MKRTNRDNTLKNPVPRQQNYRLSNIKRIIQTVANYAAYQDGHNDIDRLFTEMNSLTEEFESDYISWNIARIITNFTINLREAKRVIKGFHERSQSADEIGCDK